MWGWLSRRKFIVGIIDLFGELIMGSSVLLGGKLMFPSDYVSAPEFLGRDVTLTIAGVRIETLAMQGGQKKAKPILTFKETKKKLVLNKTNAASISEMHGNAAEKWVGKRITVYPTKTRFGSQVVDCIRVRENGQAKKASPPTDSPFPEQHDAELAEADDGDVFGGSGSRGGEPSPPSSPPDPEPAHNPQAADPQPEPAGVAGDSALGEPWPTKMPEPARTDDKFILEAVNQFRPREISNHQAKRIFRAARAPHSWEKLSPGAQDELYAALMGGTFAWK